MAFGRTGDQSRRYRRTVGGALLRGRSCEGSTRRAFDGNLAAPTQQPDGHMDPPSEPRTPASVQPEITGTPTDQTAATTAPASPGPTGEVSGAHGSDLTGLAVIVIATLFAGMLMRRLKQPALVGYILAGVVLGPSVVGLVENRDSVQLLAEMGVLLLLFFVGMELSLRGVRRVWIIAIITTAVQIGAGVGGMMVVASQLGWKMDFAVLLGFGVALSSTAVAIKILEEIDELRTQPGKLAVGILIAQDLAVVPMMLIIDGMGGGAGIGLDAVLKVLLSVGLLAGLIVFLSRRQRVKLPFSDLLESNEDLAALGGLGFCFGAATVSGLVGLSPAYGAFLAGLTIGNSTLRVKMHEAVGPIQSVLLMVFFMSIGLLIDLAYLWQHLVMVLAILVAITAAKTLLNLAVLRALGQDWKIAGMAGLVLAQIGEFTFLLAALGLSTGILSADNHQLLIAVTVLSLATAPFWYTSAERLHRAARSGYTSGRDLLHKLYGSEAHVLLKSSGWLARTAVHCAGVTARGARRLCLPSPPQPVEMTPPTRSLPGTAPQTLPRRSAADPVETEGDAGFEDGEASDTADREEPRAATSAGER
jgi:CPA2 family monovalent cation:H+ antiporter-2